MKFPKHYTSKFLVRQILSEHREFERKQYLAALRWAELQPKLIARGIVSEKLQIIARGEDSEWRDLTSASHWNMALVDHYSKVLTAVQMVEAQGWDDIPMEGVQHEGWTEE